MARGFEVDSTIEPQSTESLVRQRVVGGCTPAWNQPHPRSVCQSPVPSTGLLADGPSCHRVPVDSRRVPSALDLFRSLLDVGLKGALFRGPRAVGGRSGFKGRPRWIPGEVWGPVLSGLGRFERFGNDEVDGRL